MKNIVSILVICIMTLAIALTGCQQATVTTTTEGTTTAGETTGGTTSNMTPAGEFPIVKDKITLKFLAKPSVNVADITTNYCTKWLEEKTNIHIEFEILPQTDYKQKVTLLISSGSTLPDVIMGCGFSNGELLTYGTQGVIQPLNQMIDQYGVSIKDWWVYNPQIKVDMTAPDGNIYGIGSYNECFHCSHCQKMWINQTWLDKLQLKTPTTTDEFYEVLKAFKDGDPNGNGLADEIPLSGTYKSWMENIDGYMMCPFVYNDSDTRLIVTAGDKVDAAFTQDAWRDGLTYLNKLYTEGLLDSECFVQEESQVKQLVDGDTCLLGSVPSGFMGCFSNMTNDNWKQFTTLAPLTGPKGVCTTGNFLYQVSGASFVITKDNKYPVESFRWGDFCTTEEAYHVIFFGEENVDWRLANAGEVGLDGKESSAVFKEVNYISSGTTPQNKCWNWSFPVWLSNADFIGRVSDPADIWYVEAILYRETFNKYQNYEPKKVVASYYMNIDDSTEYGTLKSQIDTYVLEMIAKFVTGEASLANDWDSYISEFETLGLKRYLELVQKYYDAAAQIK